MRSVIFNGVTSLSNSVVRATAWYEGALILLPGLFCLLLGIALPTSGLYYQLIIVLLWLPTLYLLVRQRQNWLNWFSPLMSALTLFFAWAMLSSLWSNSDEPGRDIKHALMIYLTLWAGVLLADIERRWLVYLLITSCYVMAGLAAISLYATYIFHGLPMSVRLASFWQLSHSILAAHVFGFFLIVLLYFRPAGLIRQSAWCVALLLLAAFVFFTQSRGVWVAVGAGLVFTAIFKRERIYALAVLVGIAASALVVALRPELMTGRGLSYRPELVFEGLSLMSLHPLGGHGIGGAYSLTLDGTGKVFDHPHNLFLSVGLDLGGIGLSLWVVIWGLLLLTAWRNRHSALGGALLGVWCFASVACLTDGADIWSKPREVWFLSWIPLTLALSLGATKSRAQALPQRQSGV